MAPSFPRSPYPSVHTRWITLHPSHDILRPDSHPPKNIIIHTLPIQLADFARTNNFHLPPSTIYTYILCNQSPSENHTTHPPTASKFQSVYRSQISNVSHTPVYNYTSKMYSCVNQPRGCRGRVNTPGGRCDSCRVSYLYIFPPIIITLTDHLFTAIESAKTFSILCAQPLPKTLGRPIISLVLLPRLREAMISLSHRNPNQSNREHISPKSPLPTYLLLHFLSINYFWLYF